MRRVLLFLLCANCTFISPRDNLKRLDGDGDGVLFPEDCNDERKGINALSGWDGTLECGDLRLLEAGGGGDELGFVECEKVEDLENTGTVDMHGNEVVFEFSHDEPTDVTVIPLTGEVQMIAIRGRFCDDYCTSPIVDELNFRVEADELWFIVVDTDGFEVEEALIQVSCMADQ